MSKDISKIVIPESREKVDEALSSIKPDVDRSLISQVLNIGLMAMLHAITEDGYAKLRDSNGNQVDPLMRYVIGVDQWSKSLKTALSYAIANGQNVISLGVAFDNDNPEHSLRSEFDLSTVQEAMFALDEIVQSIVVAMENPFNNNESGENDV